MAGQQATEAADRLVGMKVYNIAGKKLGEVCEVKTDDQTGEIDCVIVEDEGILGFRKHRISMAWSMLSYSETRHALVFAPGVHGDHEDHLPPVEATEDRPHAAI